MVKVWGRNNSVNVQKVLWTCVEVDVGFERIDVGGPFGGLDTAEYLALNPNRRIPTIEDDGFVLWESNAIVRYLAARYGGGLCPAEVQARALAEQWMDWNETRLDSDLTTVFWGLIRTPEERRDYGTIERSIHALIEIWGILDGHLAGQPYVAGDRFTVGDIPVGSTAHRWLALPLERPPMPHLEAWYGRLCERPGYRDHVARPLS